MSSRDVQVDRCGCCAPPAARTPALLDNRPGLPEVAYRVGTWESFRQSMVDLVPDHAVLLAREAGLATVPLDGWTSREDDDYGMALLSLWATVCDVLAFHTERYANDAWLRTATSSEALLRLAALVGYRPRPGVAARTTLTYRLKAGTELDLAAGLRVRSTPRAGEVPQVFETTAPLAASWRLNDVPVLGLPRPVAPLGAGRAWITLPAEVAAPAPGARVLLWTATATDEREVGRVDVVDGRPVLHWSRPLAADATSAAVAGRAWRICGHAAPPTFLTTAPAGSGGFLTFTSQATQTAFAGTALELEGRVEGLQAGASLLVVGPAGVAQRTVVSVAQGTATVAGQALACTRVTLSGAVTGDRRTTVVHELVRALPALPWEVPYDTVPAGTTEVAVPAGRSGLLTAGRRVVLDDGTAAPVLATVAAAPTPLTGVPGFVRVPLAEPLPRDLLAGSAALTGNVVAAGHGETVPAEVLGDADPAVPFARYRLATAPLTYVADPAAPGGARSTAEIRVGGVRWHQRAALSGAGPREEVYALERDPDGRTWVRFGDGTTGALPPAGRRSVVARYRHGVGAGGNLAAGQVATAVDRPTGVDTVVNPVVAEGGVDPEPADTVRANAPGRSARWTGPCPCSTSPISRASSPGSTRRTPRGPGTVGPVPPSSPSGRRTRRCRGRGC